MQFSVSRPASLLVIGAVVVLGLAALLIPSRAQSQSSDPGSAIVARALQDVGTWQGECWPWVRKVVAEVTGNEMGFGYRDGFFEGGAIEVSLSEAQPGDIIQLADDNNNGPGVNYPGLHTVIVYEVLGDGIFDVIDSNSEWDGMVRIRPNYDPVWAANRFTNITPRAYRFENHGSGGGSAPSPIPTPPAVQVDFGLGDTVRVDAPSSCLNLRRSAGGQVERCITHGTLLTVISEPVAAGQHTWVEVETEDGERGWVAVQFVHLVDSSVPGSSAPPGDETPTPEPEGPEGPGIPDPSTLTHRLVVPGIATDD